MTTLILVALTAATLAQTPDFPPATEQAIRSYALDQQKATALIAALRDITAWVMKDPKAMTTMLTQMTELPFEQQGAALEKGATTGPILKANGLTGRQYSFGILALRSAYLARDGGSAGLARLANPANVAFLKANPAIADRFAQADMGK